MDHAASHDRRHALTTGEAHTMIVRGITGKTLDELFALVDMEGDNIRPERKDGTAWGFKLRPHSSSSAYARRSPSGRRGPWACSHGFEEFITAAFDAGAESVTAVGADGGRQTYRSRAEFRQWVPALKERNIGSMAAPVAYVDLCDCPDEDYR
jgi:hypothetical protein